ncbi:MAG: hypothetical protein R3C17_13450 [Planctomycetaceae bacterium]
MFEAILGQDIVTGGAGSDTIDFSTRSTGVTFDLDLSGILQSLGGPEGVTLNDAIENVIGSMQADTFQADFLPGGVTRLIQGSDPTMSPGDELIVDFQNAAGGYTMRGVGRGDYRLLGGGFGQIDFESIESPGHQNIASLNFTLQPDVPAGPYRISREGDSIFFTDDEGSIYGSDGSDFIHFIEVIGSDAADDELIVDLTGGPIAPPAGIHFSGGVGGNDLLTMLGNGAGDYTYAPSATTFGDGEISETGGLQLTFDGLEPVNLMGFGSITVAPPNADDQLTLEGAVFGGDGYLVVRGTSGGVAMEELRVASGTLLKIDTTANSADGNDVIDVNGSTTLHGVTNVEIVTGSGLDQVRVNGTETLIGSMTIGSQGEVVGNGTGFLDSLVNVRGATVDPKGGGVGILRTGPISFDAGSTFKAEVRGKLPGSDHDQLVVHGAADLGGAALDVSGAIVGTSPGDVIVLINLANSGSSVSGTFAGLPEGSQVLLNGQNFSISYAGGDGNDVTLTATAVPPMEVYVDDDLFGTANGTPIADANPDAPGAQPGTFGVDVFSRIVDGIAAISAGGTVHVVGGLYDEDIRISKPLTIDGTGSDRRDARLGGSGVFIESGGDDVTLGDLWITSELSVSGVAAPLLRNVISSGYTGLMGRNLTGVLRVESSLFQANQFTSFDVDSPGLHVVIEDSTFQANTLGPIEIQNVDSLTLRNTTFRGNTAGISLRSIETLTYDTEQSDVSDAIEFSNNTLKHRRNGVARDSLELLSIQNLAINTFGGEDHVTGRTHFAMSATIDTGNNLSGDSITIEGSEISDAFTTTINGTDTELRNRTHAPLILRGMESLILKGNAGADRFDVAPTRDYSILVEGGGPIGQNGEPTSFDVLNIVAQAQQFAYLNGPENGLVVSSLTTIYQLASISRIGRGASPAAPDGLPTFKSFPLPFGNPKGNPVDVESGGDGEVKVSQGNFKLRFSELEPEEQVVLDLTESSDDVNFNLDGQPYAQDFVIRGSGANHLVLNGGIYDETTLDLLDNGSVQLTINPTITMNGMSGLVVNSGVKAINLNGSAANDVFVIEDALNGNTSVTLALAQSLFRFKVNLPIAAEKLTIKGAEGDDIVHLNSVGSAFVAALTIDGEAGNDVIRVPNFISLPNVIWMVADLVEVQGGLNTSSGGQTAGIQIDGATLTVNDLITSGGSIRLDAVYDIDVQGSLLTGGGRVAITASHDVHMGVDAAIDVQVPGPGSLVEISIGQPARPERLYPNLNNPEFKRLITPDGRWLVFESSSEGIGVQSVDGGPVRFINFSGGFELSADGTQIIHWNSSGLFSIPVTGGMSTRLSQRDITRLKVKSQNEIVFTVFELGTTNLYHLNTTSQVETQLATDIEDFLVGGQTVVYSVISTTTGKSDLFASIAGQPAAILASDTGSLVELTPNEKYVVYWDDLDGDGERDLVSIPSTGGNAVQLSNFQNKSVPWISATDTHLVYVISSPIEHMLFVVPIVGGVTKQIGSPRAGVFLLSPDGTKLAYSSGDTLYISTLDGQAVTSTSNVGDSLPWGFSPDGRQVLVRSPEAISSISSDGGSPILIAMHSGLDEVLVQDPVFAPDSGTFFYVVSHTPSVLTRKWESHRGYLPGRIVMEPSSAIRAHDASVQLSALLDVTVATITSSANVDINSLHGRIVDATNTELPNITATSALLRASAGIGHEDELDLSVARVTFQNADNGDVNLHTTDNVRVDVVSGLTSSTNTNGDVTIFTEGSISVSHNLRGRNVALRALEKAGSLSENINIQSGVTLLATSRLDLIAGDDIEIESGAAIQGNEITLSSGERDQDSAGAITISGSINATGSLTLSSATGISETGTGAIRAMDLVLRGKGQADLFAGTNNASHLAGLVEGDVTYVDIDGLRIGEFDTYGADLNVTADELTIDGHVNGQTGRLAMAARVNGLTQIAGASVQAHQLYVQGGAFHLDEQRNDIDLIAGSVASLVLSDKDDVEVSTVSYSFGNSSGGLFGIVAHGDIAISAPTVRLNSRLNSETGRVAVNGIRSDGSDGDFEITGASTEVTAVSVEITNARLSADQLGRSLSIDTSSATAGGNILLPEFDTTLPLLNRLVIDASGGATDGEIQFVNGVFLANAGANRLADLTVRGNIELDQPIALVTSSSFASGGTIDLADANFYASLAGASLTIDSRAKSGSIGSLGTGGSIQLGKFSAPLGSQDIDDLTILSTGGLGDGTTSIHHDVFVDGNVTIEGILELPAATTISTSSNIGAAGAIDLRKTVIQRSSLTVPSLMLEAAYFGNSARNNSGGNITLGSLSGLNEVAINTTSFSGSGGNVLVEGKVQVEKLQVAGSHATAANPSTIIFWDDISLGLGGLHVSGADEVVLANAEATGDVVLSANQFTRLLEGIRTQGGNIVIEGDVQLAGNNSAPVKRQIVLDTRLDDSGDAGSVRLFNGKIYGYSEGAALLIDTKSNSVGGVVVLDSEFASPANFPLVNDLVIVTSGATDGIVSLGSHIHLGSYLPNYSSCGPVHLCL